MPVTFRRIEQKPAPTWPLHPRHVNEPAYARVIARGAYTLDWLNLYVLVKARRVRGRAA